MGVGCVWENEPRGMNGSEEDGLVWLKKWGELNRGEYKECVTEKRRMRKVDLNVP